jgi:hypothetical protein
MRIELMRTETPEDLGAAQCAICGDGFEQGTVTAWTRDLAVANPWACPSCVEVLGAYRPDRFPTIEEHRRLEAEWPTTEYASGDEADAALEADYQRYKLEKERCA